MESIKKSITMRTCEKSSSECSDDNKAVGKCVSCQNGGAETFNYVIILGDCFCVRHPPQVPLP